MAVTYPTTVRNGIADYILGLTDAGAGAGYLEFQTAGGLEVATLAMSDPAWPAAASGQAAANAISNDVSATGGLTTKGILADSDGNTVMSYSVGTAGEDINLSDNNIPATAIVSITSLTYVAPGA